MIPQVISRLADSVPHNLSDRFNCPFCGKVNTLSISKENGKIRWNCFSAHCDAGGKDKYLISTQEIKERYFLREKEGLDIPTYLIHGIGSEKVLEWLLKTHSDKAYRNGMFEVAYDPRQDRICYLIRDKGKIVGIIGRSFGNSKPKVLNYKGSDKDTPFIAGSTETIVLLEDCASACAVTRIPELSGLALLGTNLKDEYIPVIKKYNRVIVALDRDARKKVLAMWSKLKYHCSHVEIWFLDKDIKDMLDNELEESYIKFNAKSLSI